MIPRLYKSENLAPLIPDRAALHEIACAFAEEQFKLKGEAPSTWLVAVGTGIAWVETPFEGTSSKDVAAYMIRTMLEHTKAQAYSFVSEVWIGALGNMEDAKRKKWIAFSNEHGVGALPAKLRDDALMIMTYDRHGGLSITRYLVTLRKGKGPNFLGPRVDETDEMHGMAGRMHNLFEPEKQ